MSPGKFSGPQIKSLGKTLKFDLAVSGSDPVFASEDLVLQGRALTLVAALPSVPTASWTTYTIRLDGTGHWKVGISGPSATDAQISQCLEFLDGLLIRSGYRQLNSQQVLSDKAIARLDNVRIAP